MKGLNTKSFGHIYTSPSLFHYKIQIPADSLDPIKIDIFVEKSKVQIKKACIIWIKDIKKPISTFTCTLKNPIHVFVIVGQPAIISI